MRRAESVLQNCVMGRCAICIFMYCYISLQQQKYGLTSAYVGVSAKRNLYITDTFMVMTDIYN